MLVLPFERSTRYVDREKCFDLQTLVSFSLSLSLSPSLSFSQLKSEVYSTNHINSRDLQERQEGDA